MLMRFTRGSTGKARAGIPFSRPFQNGLLFRPFLNVTKEDIEQYCKDHKLSPRIDPSNLKNTYSRNRFRKEVLPFLKSENRQVHEHFQRFSEELQNDEEFLQELTVQRMNTVMTKRENSKIIIDIKRFLDMPLPLQRRGIQLILNYLYKEKPAALSAIHIDQVFSVIHQSGPSGKLDLPNGLKVIRSYLNLSFQFDVTDVQKYYFEISKPGRIELPSGGCIQMEYIDKEPFDTTRCYAIFSAEEMKLPLIVRSRRLGDRMSLKGMSGTKKLKDIFIDHKVSIENRETWPVISNGEDCIIWLPGLKKSSFEGINNKAKKYLLLTYNK
jgi:tRNA(Ile)-lysidine synthase